jgi:hypothetical protein
MPMLQDISSSIKLSIYKASSAHKVFRFTIGHYLISRLLRYKAHPNLLYSLQEEQIIK